MAEVSTKDTLLMLDWMPNIHYQFRSQKNIAGVKALTNFGSEVNIMTPAYVLKLGLKTHYTNIGA